MSACQGCGAAIAQPPHSGRRRKWCSDRCRKRTTYAGSWSRCGAETSGLEGGRANAPDLCARCQREDLTAESRAASVCYRGELEALWAEGLTVDEIAAELGATPSSLATFIVKARREGANLPYRRKFSEAGIARLRAAGRDAAMRLARERLAA